MGGHQRSLHDGQSRISRWVSYLACTSFYQSSTDSVQGTYDEHGTRPESVLPTSPMLKDATKRSQCHRPSSLDPFIRLTRLPWFRANLECCLGTPCLIEENYALPAGLDDCHVIRPDARTDSVIVSLSNRTAASLTDPCLPSLHQLFPDPRCAICSSSRSHATSRFSHYE